MLNNKLQCSLFVNRGMCIKLVKLQVPLAGWIQILGYCAYCEIGAGYDADINKRTPGDMGWNPPIFSGNDPETKTRRLNAELANGRLAMMAIIGMFFQA